MSAADDEPAPARGSEDRLAPAIVYGLYLLGLTHGLTIVIGLVVAYATRGGAGPRAASHLTFLIRTFWLSIAWFVIGAALTVVGAIFTLVLVGIPVLWLGLTICGLIWLWMLIRCVVGAIVLAQGDAHPRPYTWWF